VIPLMSLEQLFATANAIALICWLALAASPFRARWSARVRVVAGQAVPLLFALAYGALFLRSGMGDGGYGSLAAVQRLMAVPDLLTAGWLHYLAFDLFVGAWIAERAGALGMPHLLIVPLLALTWLFGPLGWLGFVVLRALWRLRRPAQPAMA